MADLSSLALLFLGQGPHDPGWYSKHQVPGRNGLTGSHQRSRTHLGTSFHDGTIENTSADADQRSIPDRTTMQDRAVSYYNFRTKAQRILLVGHVKNRAVLNVRPFTDMDLIYITPSHRVKPEGNVVADFDFSGHHCG